MADHGGGKQPGIPRRCRSQCSLEEHAARDHFHRSRILTPTCFHIHSTTTTLTPKPQTQQTLRKSPAEKISPMAPKPHNPPPPPQRVQGTRKATEFTAWLQSPALEPCDSSSRRKSIHAQKSPRICLETTLRNHPTMFSSPSRVESSRSGLPLQLALGDELRLLSESWPHTRPPSTFVRYPGLGFVLASINTGITSLEIAYPCPIRLKSTINGVLSRNLEINLVVLECVF